MKNKTSKYHFDEKGRLIEESFADGTARQFAYDAAGNQTVLSQFMPLTGPSDITVTGFAKKNQGDFLNNAMLVMLSNGAIVGWGDNTTGVLANGISAATNQPPQRVLFDPNTTLPPSSATIVDWTFTNCNLYVVFSNGWAYSAGKNAYGQLGHGDTVARPFLKRIEALTGGQVTKVWACGGRQTTDGGGCAYFQMSDYSMYGCGANTAGNLGNAATPTTNVSTPAPCAGIPTSPVHVVDVAIASVNTSFSAYMLMSDGTLQVAGYNAQGQLSVNTTTNVTGGFQTALMWFYPMPVPPGAPYLGAVTNIKSVSANGGYNGSILGGNVIIVLNDGTVMGCGYNAHSELGGGTTNQTTFGPFNLSNIVEAELGGGPYGYGYAIDAAGLLYTWGYNGQNNLFKNTTTSPQAPSLATFLPGLASKVVFPKGNYLSGNSQLLVLTTGGDLVYAGVDDGQLPTDSAVNPGAYSYIRLPKAILDGIENIIDIFAHGTSTTQRYFLLTDAGNLYACGNNADSVCLGGIASNVIPTAVSCFKLNLVVIDG
jgi:YD repeat-containing protein